MRRTLKRLLVALIACLGLVAIAPATGAQAATGRMYTCAGNNDATLVDMGAVGWAWMGGSSGRDCMGEGTRFFGSSEPQRIYVDPGTCAQMSINGGPLGPVKYGGGWTSIYGGSGLTGTWATMVYHWRC